MWKHLATCSQVSVSLASFILMYKTLAEPRRVVLKSKEQGEVLSTRPWLMAAWTCSSYAGRFKLNRLKRNRIIRGGLISWLNNASDWRALLQRLGKCKNDESCNFMPDENSWLLKAEGSYVDVFCVCFLPLCFAKNSHLSISFSSTSLSVLKECFLKYTSWK